MVSKKVTPSKDYNMSCDLHIMYCNNPKTKAPAVYITFRVVGAGIIACCVVYIYNNFASERAKRKECDIIQQLGHDGGIK